MRNSSKPDSELRYQEVKALVRINGSLTDREIADMLNAHHRRTDWISVRRVNQIRLMSDKGRPVNLQYGQDVLKTQEARQPVATVQEDVQEPSAFERRAAKIEELTRCQIEALIRNQIQVDRPNLRLAESEIEALVQLAYKATLYRTAEIVPDLVAAYLKASRGVQ